MALGNLQNALNIEKLRKTIEAHRGSIWLKMKPGLGRC